MEGNRMFGRRGGMEGNRMFGRRGGMEGNRQGSPPCLISLQLKKFPVRKDREFF